MPGTAVPNGFIIGWHKFTAVAAETSLLQLGPAVFFVPGPRSLRGRRQLQVSPGEARSARLAASVACLVRVAFHMEVKVGTEMLCKGCHNFMASI